jgi:hypothetical protein
LQQYWKRKGEANEIHTTQRSNCNNMSLPDFERVEKLLRLGSIICGLSLIPRSFPFLLPFFVSSNLSCSGVFGLLDIFDPMYMVVSGAAAPQ